MSTTNKLFWITTTVLAIGVLSGCSYCSPLLMLALVAKTLTSVTQLLQPHYRKPERLQLN